MQMRTLTFGFTTPTRQAALLALVRDACVRLYVYIYISGKIAACRGWFGVWRGGSAFNSQYLMQMFDKLCFRA